VTLPNGPNRKTSKADRLGDFLRLVLPNTREREVQLTAIIDGFERNCERWWFPLAYVWAIFVDTLPLTIFLRFEIYSQKSFRDTRAEAENTSRSLQTAGLVLFALLIVSGLLGWQPLLLPLVGVLFLTLYGVFSLEWFFNHRRFLLFGLPFCLFTMLGSAFLMYFDSGIRELLLSGYAVLDLALFPVTFQVAVVVFSELLYFAVFYLISWFSSAIVVSLFLWGQFWRAR
jgi:hypothetical protein